MTTLVLVRHGQSTWNAENRFTGWWDVALTPVGEEQARSAGTLMAEAGIALDVVHTSLQSRAIRTANLALEAADRAHVVLHLTEWAEFAALDPEALGRVVAARRIVDRDVGGGERRRLLGPARVPERGGDPPRRRGRL